MKQLAVGFAMAFISIGPIHAQEGPRAYIENVYEDASGNSLTVYVVLLYDNVVDIAFGTMFEGVELEENRMSDYRIQVDPGKGTLLCIDGEGRDKVWGCFPITDEYVQIRRCNMTYVGYERASEDGPWSEAAKAAKAILGLGGPGDCRVFRVKRTY